MKSIFKNIQGDSVIWAIIGVLAIFSFLPVYSASSNLAYLYGDGNTFKFLAKHFAHLVLGFGILYGVHKIPYHYFRGLSMIALPIVVVLLLITMAQGTTIGGANASRWIRVPLVGVTFQTSTLAAVVLMTYVARYLSTIESKLVSFKETLLPLWLPVFLIIGLILPANFSTAAIIFAMVVLLVFIGGYPFRYLAIILTTGLLLLSLFVLSAKAFPDVFPNRVDTWISRVASFVDKTDKDADYQIIKAKTAIASGGITGLGPGKSVQKNFLPQSNSDFVFAVITEEYGLIGASGVVLLYMALFRRFVRIARRAHTKFGTLLVLAAASGMILQTLVNMGVATNLMPVTGQTLPFLSAGGSSIWMTCIALGIILSVSHTDVKKIVGKNAQSQEEHENAEAHV